MVIKPFNLERALAGDPVVTRENNPVTQLHSFETTDFFSIAGIYNGYMSNEQLGIWNKEGKFYRSSEDHANDLFMACRTVTKWVNIYRGVGIEKKAISLGMELMDSEELAIAHGKKAQEKNKFFDYITSQPISWEE